jgi:hypothetical protein
MADILATSFLENTTPAGTRGMVVFNESTGELERLTVDEFKANAMVIESGTYTPTVTLITNLDSVSVPTAYCRYSRVGNVVSVSAVATVNLTATGSSFFTMSLPVASTLNFAFDLIGSVSPPNGVTSIVSSSVQGYTATNSASVIMDLSVTSNQNTLVFFQYTIV